MKNELIKHLFDLQLFADDDPDGAQPEGAGDNDGEDPSDGEGDGDDDEHKEPEKKYSDADIDKMKKRWKKEQEKKLAEAREDAERKAKMTAEQKKQAEFKDLQKENERLKAENLRNELSKKASNLLAEKGKIVASQAMLDFVVGEDEDDTADRVDELIGIIQEQIKISQKKAATGTTPKGTGGSDGEFDPFRAKYDKYK